MSYTTNTDHVCEYDRYGKLTAAFGYRKGDLYRIVATGRSKAAKLFGTEGTLAWLAVTGDPKAWPSSPNRERVARIGLKVEGQADYVFVDARHALRIERLSTPEDRIMMDAVIEAFASLCA